MTPREVLEHYSAEYRAYPIVPLGSGGGFSGADLWRLNGPRERFCLRCWPPKCPTYEGLLGIHRVLRHAAGFAGPALPVPVPNPSRETIVVDGDRLWELAPWLPGAPDFARRPSVARLRAAMTALAQFHAATSSFPREAIPADMIDPIASTEASMRENAASTSANAAAVCESGGQSSAVGISPGVVRRRALLRAWLGDGGKALESAVAACAAAWPEFAHRASIVLALASTAASRVDTLLAEAAERPVPLRIVLRDVTRDHVLFEGERVTGLVDFGSMAVDSVAADAARLLGSAAGDDFVMRHLGLDAYQAVRPLDPAETALVEAFDRSTVLLSGVQWIDWICRRQRRFDDPGRVVERMDEIIVRLQALSRWASGDAGLVIPAVP